MTPQRVQKLLAAAGYGSRREIEGWIDAGRVSIDGRIARLGDRATGAEVIALDGRRLPVGPTTPAYRHLMYNKPADEICSRSDRQGRRRVFDALPALNDARWVAVGTLDMTTTGLLLFTTDGGLANALMHPSSGVLRRYAVRVRGNPSRSELARLRRGVELEDGVAALEQIEPAGGTGTNRWFTVALKEGGHDEVRRLWSAIGYDVTRLIRVAYGPIELPRSLHQGQYEALTPAQVRLLYLAAGLEAPPGVRRRRRRAGATGR